MPEAREPGGQGAFEPKGRKPADLGGRALNQNFTRNSARSLPLGMDPGFKSCPGRSRPDLPGQGARLGALAWHQRAWPRRTPAR